MESIIDQVRAAVSIPCLYLISYTLYRPARDIFDDELVRAERSYFFIRLFTNTCHTKICFARRRFITALGSPI
jgi:hypothetical protein